MIGGEYVIQPRRRRAANAKIESSEVAQPKTGVARHIEGLPAVSSAASIECARFMPDPLPYRDFYYPLNVLMHVLTLEEGSVSYLHYGLFEREDESIARAQERSTELLLSRLPSPPARLLDVGLGLGTSLARLARLGYRATGITPDEKQFAAVRERYGSNLDVRCVAFEAMDEEPFDIVIFQESSQYIDSEKLFARAEAITGRIVVLDEFAMKAGKLHSLPEFIAAAERHRYGVIEEIDLSEKAAPTIDYFRARLPRHRERLVAEIGVTSEQVDDLIASGERYRELYRSGTYVYRLLTFQR